MPTWRELLRAERTRRGVSQSSLATLAGVSVRTVERYERGASTPVRTTLLRLCRALQLSNVSLNTILTAAEFVPRPLVPGRPSGLRVLQASLASYPWPALVLNERVEIVAWNRPATLVAELDFARVLPLPHQRNLIRIATMDHFVQRMLNWHEVVTVMVGMFAGNQYDFIKPDRDPLYFKAIVDDAAKSDGPHLNALMQLWLRAPPREEEARTTLPIHWQLANGQKLAFNCVITSGNRFMGAQEFDWFPADAATWEFLAAAAQPGRAVDARTPAQMDGTASEDSMVELSTGELLREARRGSGLTQRALARRSGISAHTITSLETDRRRPTRELANRLIDALQLDGVTTNELLQGLGFEPEPSDWARFVAGEPQRHGYFRFPAAERARRAREHVAERIGDHSWSCLVVDERGHIVAVNDALIGALPQAAASALKESGNLVPFLLSPSAQATFANWEEATAGMLSGLLRQQPGSTNAGIDGAFLIAAIDELLRQDPSVRPAVERLAELLSVPAQTDRVVFPVLLRDGPQTARSFIGTVARWSDFERLWVLDWQAADGATWT